MTGRGADPPGHPVLGQVLSRVVRTTSPRAQASGFVVEVGHSSFLVTAAEVVGEGVQRLLVTFRRANRLLEVETLGEVGANRAAVCRITSANFIPPFDIPPLDWLPGASQRVFSIGFLRGVRGLGAAANVPFVLGGTVAAVARGGRTGSSASMVRSTREWREGLWYAPRRGTSGRWWSV